MRPPFGTLLLSLPCSSFASTSPMDTVGWPVLKSGFASAREIVWLEVRNMDLPLHVDPVALLKEKLAAQGLR